MWLEVINKLGLIMANFHVTHIRYIIRVHIQAEICVVLKHGHSQESPVRDCGKRFLFSWLKLDPRCAHMPTHLHENDGGISVVVNADNRWVSPCFWSSIRCGRWRLVSGQLWLPSKQATAHEFEAHGGWCLCKRMR